MELPVEPKAEDCCNSGCNPCIYDIYEQQLKLYRYGNYSQEERKENGIFELKYTTFAIVSSNLLCDEIKVLKFQRYNQDNAKVWWSPGDHFLYKYVNDSLSCTRAYTPIKLDSEKDKDFDFSIVIKRYKNGLVSNHLFDLEEGELTLWRGPYGSYKIEPNTFKRLIMIAQGTGIAPFMTIIESILNNEDDITDIILFYCCRSLDEILFRDDLRTYGSYWNFSYKVFLTGLTSDIDIRYKEPIITHKFSFEDLAQVKPFKHDQILICGSTEFMTFYSSTLRDQLDLVKNIIIF